MLFKGPWIINEIDPQFFIVVSYKIEPVVMEAVLSWPLLNPNINLRAFWSVTITVTFPFSEPHSKLRALEPEWKDQNITVPLASQEMTFWRVWLTLRPVMMALCGLNVPLSLVWQAHRDKYAPPMKIRPPMYKDDVGGHF